MRSTCGVWRQPGWNIYSRYSPGVMVVRWMVSQTWDRCSIHRRLTKHQAGYLMLVVTECASLIGAQCAREAGVTARRRAGTDL